ncbi:hypothetical protein P9112_012301 [Eukaryota sp. TZLM1-RC]
MNPSKATPNCSDKATNTSVPSKWEKLKNLIRYKSVKLPEVRPLQIFPSRRDELQVHVELPHCEISLLTQTSITRDEFQQRISQHFDSTGVSSFYPSAEVLLHHLYSLDLRDLSILEVGAGIGLCSIGLATLPQHEVPGRLCCTDANPTSISLIQRSLQLNKSKITIPIEVKEHCWGLDSIGLFDLIVGSDVLFFGDYHSNLLQTFSSNLSSSGTVLIAAPNRVDTAKNFIDKASEDWIIKTIELTGKSKMYMDEVFSSGDCNRVDEELVVLYELKRK